jgi:hypothetical protein
LLGRTFTSRSFPRPWVEVIEGTVETDDEIELIARCALKAIISLQVQYASKTTMTLKFLFKMTNQGVASGRVYLLPEVDFVTSALFSILTRFDSDKLDIREIERR